MTYLLYLENVVFVLIQIWINLYVIQIPTLTETKSRSLSELSNIMWWIFDSIWSHQSLEVHLESATRKLLEIHTCQFCVMEGSASPLDCGELSEVQISTSNGNSTENLSVGLLWMPYEIGNEYCNPS